ncbi:MAG: TolC family protein [Bacteroidales bacterium]|nr:TolC family protein [Bacteroidales bacterium]
MKHIFLTFAGIVAVCSGAFPQKSIDKILAEIDKNNTTLSALRKSAEADKIGNKTAIYLQNPEVTFNYLWGSPTIIGNRTDFSISQSFDFPLAYSLKNQISDQKNEQIEFEFQRQYKSLLLKARNICLDLVYSNALKSELTKRLASARLIADSFKAKFDLGETNVLEYNKAQLNLLNLYREMENIEIERKTLLSELAGLNGGQPIDFQDSIYLEPVISSDFEQWYIMAEQNNPVLGWLKKELEISQKQVKLTTAMGLPKFKTAYMSETVVGEKFQGITVGLTIPMWENKNGVKLMKSKTIALESITFDNKLQFYNHLKSIHSKTISIRKNLEEYRTNLTRFDNSEFLKTALDKGEISLINYIVELSLYYENVNMSLALERELHKSYAELMQYQ